MKTKYGVLDGPDSRHLIWGVVFNTKAEARAYVEKLPKNRAYQMSRLVFPSAYSVWENKTVLDQRII